jgi:hypothetical protein
MILSSTGLLQSIVKETDPFLPARRSSSTPRRAPSTPLPQLAARVDPKIWRLGFPDTRGATDATDEQPWRGDDEGGDDHFQMARKQ